MAQYAILIYADDSAHSAEVTPEERDVHDRHAQDPEESRAMVAAFALEPRETATSIRVTRCRTVRSSTSRRSWRACT